MVWFGLQGDMNEAIEPYLKDDRNVEKVSSKMHKQIKGGGISRITLWKI